MDATIINQAYLFGIYSVCGIIIGIFFDLFRILRRSFKTPDIITYIEDIIFGILTGVFLIFIIFVFNNGELRFYIFIALILSLIEYNLNSFNATPKTFEPNKVNLLRVFLFLKLILSTKIQPLLSKVIF